MIISGFFHELKLINLRLTGGHFERLTFAPAPLKALISR